MVVALDLMRQGAGDLATLTRSHGGWMTWNLFLAVVPLGLAIALFAPSRRTGVAWWSGVGLFVLFLPNAPYVLTDVIHLLDDIRGSRSDLQVLGLYLPLYLAFFTIGVASYTISLHRLWRFVTARRSLRAAATVELALHLICALGVYLGRVVRLNSWHVFTRPRSVVGSLDSLSGPVPVAAILLTAALFLACSALWRLGYLGARAVLPRRHRLLRDLARSFGHRPPSTPPAPAT